MKKQKLKAKQRKKQKVKRQKIVKYPTLALQLQNIQHNFLKKVKNQKREDLEDHVKRKKI